LYWSFLRLRHLWPAGFIGVKMVRCPVSPAPQSWPARSKGLLSVAEEEAGGVLGRLTIVVTQHVG
jgi:hypothetical protein